MVGVLAFDDGVERVGCGAVAAAELVVAGRDEAGVVVGATVVLVVVVENEIEAIHYGLSSEFPTFEHQMEFYHYFALRYAFSHHQEQYTYHVP